MIHARVYAASDDSIHDVLRAVTEVYATLCILVVVCDCTSWQETAKLKIFDEINQVV